MPCSKGLLINILYIECQKKMYGFDTALTAYGGKDLVTSEVGAQAKVLPTMSICQLLP